MPLLLLAILISLALLQWHSLDEWLQDDAWLANRFKQLERLDIFSHWPVLRGLLLIILPLACFSLLTYFVMSKGIIAYFLFCVLALTFCLGHGKTHEHFKQYLSACHQNLWLEAKKAATAIGLDVDHDASPKDWTNLHHQTVKALSYQGFERLFAVLFWFLFFGPVGALMYRFASINAEHGTRSSMAKTWLWAIEWPAARVLALSFVLSGNFQNCLDGLRKTFFSTLETPSFVNHVALSALAVGPINALSCELMHQEVRAVERLYNHTLWLWLGFTALVYLF